MAESTKWYNAMLTWASLSPLYPLKAKQKEKERNKSSRYNDIIILFHNPKACAEC